MLVPFPLKWIVRFMEASINRNRNHLYTLLWLESSHYTPIPPQNNLVVSLTLSLQNPDNYGLHSAEWKRLDSNTASNSISYCNVRNLDSFSDMREDLVWWEKRNSWLTGGGLNVCVREGRNGPTDLAESVHCPLVTCFSSISRLYR